MSTSYDYASGDLLDKRNSYTYTVYGGEAFLAAWRASRDEALASLPEPAPSIPEGAGTSRTDRLIEEILSQLDSDAATPALEPLLQRFEVTKRIHASYDEAWKPEDRKDFRDLARYVRFAEMLERAHEQRGDLRFLNALLKCLDTLVAFAAELDREQAARLARLLRAERSHVDRLEAAAS